MSRKTFGLSTILALFSLFFGTIAVNSQEPIPPVLSQSATSFHRGSHNQPEGRLFEPAALPEQRPTQSEEPQASGGPDDYGYTWSDNLSLSWIDAKALGANSGVYGGDAYSGPVNIGFTFPFYEFSYNQLYFNTKGMITFGSAGIWWEPSKPPVLATPNNYIAPFWDDLGMYNGGSRPQAGIYTYLGGAAPNRYFVIEWYQADIYSGNGPAGYEMANLTFEAILHENGNIVFQYLSVSTYGDVRLVPVRGIEDSDGIVGLDFYIGLQTNHAIRFTRPAASARLKAWRLAQGRFIDPGEALSFPITVRNTGNLGPDTYDLTSSTAWPAEFYRADDQTPLVDTDADGLMDTGSLAVSESMSFIVRVNTPSYLNLGEQSLTSITLQSSVSPSKSKLASLQAALPLPFTQSFIDYADSAASLELFDPAERVLKQLTPNNQVIYDQAVTESPNGNLFSAWSKDRCLTNACAVSVTEIEFTILDHDGNTLKPVTRLLDYSGAALYTGDFTPVVSIAPDGNIGIVWQHYLYDYNTYESNSNLYLAILNSSGSLVYGPLNLTNNTLWDAGNSVGVPHFLNPEIAATSDNRFVLAWIRYSWQGGSGPGYLRDLYYAIRQSDGLQITNPVKYTVSASENGPWFTNPALAALSGNRVLLATMESWANVTYIKYAVLDSVGNTKKSLSQLDMWDSGNPDVVQLTDGCILVAWDANRFNVKYAILDDVNYNLVFGPSSLPNPGGVNNISNVSVTTDRAGHAILTWMNNDQVEALNLYHAAVNSDGSLFNQPMIFRNARRSINGDYYISSSQLGYGNSSYSLPTAVPGVDASIDAPAQVTAPSGGVASIPIEFANLGQTTASQVVITVTLSADLVYLDDTLGIAPSMTGDSVVWQLPTNLGAQNYGEFQLRVGVPTAPLGTLYPLALEIDSLEADGAQANNTDDLVLVVSNYTYLPLMNR